MGTKVEVEVDASLVTLQCGSTAQDAIEGYGQVAYRSRCRMLEQRHKRER